MVDCATRLKFTDNEPAAVEIRCVVAQMANHHTFYATGIENAGLAALIIKQR
jgi:hypothetical protein